MALSERDKAAFVLARNIYTAIIKTDIPMESLRDLGDAIKEGTEYEELGRKVRVAMLAVAMKLLPEEGDDDNEEGKGADGEAGRTDDEGGNDSDGKASGDSDTAQAAKGKSGRRDKASDSIGGGGKDKRSRGNNDSARLHDGDSSSESGGSTKVHRTGKGGPDSGGSEGRKDGEDNQKGEKKESSE